MCPNSPPGPVLLQLMLLFYLRLASPPLAFDVVGCKVRSFAYIFFFFTLLLDMSFNDIVPPRRSSLSAPSPRRHVWPAAGWSARRRDRAHVPQPVVYFFRQFPKLCKIKFCWCFFKSNLCLQPVSERPGNERSSPACVLLAPLCGKMCAKSDLLHCNTFLHCVISYYSMLCIINQIIVYSKICLY